MALNKISSFQIMALIIGLMTVVAPVQGEEKKIQTPDKAAFVNGAPIDRSELEGEVLKIQKTVVGFGRPLTCAQVASIQTEVLESLIRREILYQEAKKTGIKIDQAAITKEMDALRKQFFTTAEYKNELMRRGLTEDTLRYRLEQNLAVQQYVERQFASKVAVSDNDMVSYYESHLEIFKQPLQVAASHILIQTDPKWEESRKQEARRKAEQILKSLRKGQDFSALAREQSDGPTRTSGGDLGYIKTGQLDMPLENVVFSLKQGEISDVVETSYGFHLFKVTDKKPETVLAYEKVKEKIRQFLRDEKAKQEADLRAKSLREKAAVEILLKDEISMAKRP
jgi:peptidyl-prolyl cis-trans isomerase C